MKRFIFLLIAAQFVVSASMAQQSESADGDVMTISTEQTQLIAADESHVVSEDVPTVVKTRFLPMNRRVDRHIDFNKFVYKGEWMLGLAASYGTLDASDADFMLLVDNIDFGVRRATVKPFIAYAYRDNRAVGMRFGYEYLSGGLGNVSLDLGSAADIALGISNINLKSNNYSWSIFHRNYIGLDRRGIVGAILESELLLRTGRTSFSMGSGDGINYSESRNLSARLNFNPGLGVYVFPQVCVTVTVGIGGLYYNRIVQEDLYGAKIGSRDHSGLKFKLNVADIQIGVVAHLWNKKK